MIAIYVILTVSTNLLVGMANLLSLGQAAFYGIGAYVAVFVITILKMPLIPTIISVMIITAIFSLLIALPSLRLKNDYFVLATLGFQMVVFTVLYNWSDVTGGPSGIPNINAPKMLGVIAINGRIHFLAVSLAMMGLTIYVFNKLIDSPFGRVLRGLRDDELAVVSLGKDIASFRLWTFVISSGFIGMAGMLYATYITYIDPTSFNLDEAIFILAAVLIGGTGKGAGPIYGAIFVVILPEILRFVGLPDIVAANMRQIIYGLVLIYLMLWRQQGIAGEYQVE